MGFGACDVGPSGFFLGWGSLYKRKIINLGKNGAADNDTKRCILLIILCNIRHVHVHVSNIYQMYLVLWK